MNGSQELTSGTKPNRYPAALDAAGVKVFLEDEGVDLSGIADARTLLLANPPKPPAALMPTARSVIVMAVAHTLGSVYAPDIMLWTRSKMQTSRLLDAAAEKLSRRLEREGYLSLPVSSDKPVEIHKRDPKTGRKFRQTRVLGFLSLKHAKASSACLRLGCGTGPPISGCFARILESGISWWKAARPILPMLTTALNACASARSAKRGSQSGLLSCLFRDLPGPFEPHLWGKVQSNLGKWRQKSPQYQETNTI